MVLKSLKTIPIQGLPCEHERSLSYWSGNPCCDHSTNYEGSKDNNVGVQSGTTATKGIQRRAVSTQEDGEQEGAQCSIKQGPLTNCQSCWGSWKVQNPGVRYEKAGD